MPVRHARGDVEYLLYMGYMSLEFMRNIPVGDKCGHQQHIDDTTYSKSDMYHNEI